MKTTLIRLLSIFVFATMLLFPADTLSGAATGLLLWFQTVLPTLLPCMIAADYLIRIRADRYLTRFLAKPLSLLFGISRDSAYAVLVGFLCGCPMGAKTTASLLDEGRISRREASYLLSFCNQPSPMFLTGYLCLSLLAGTETAAPIASAPFGKSIPLIPVMLLGAYGSAILVSFFYRALRRMHEKLTASDNLPYAQSKPAVLNTSTGTDANANPNTNSNPVPSLRSGPGSSSRPQKAAHPSPLQLLETSMMTSFEVMVKIGGYMILFSVLETFIGKFPFLHPALKSILMGFVEMTTGSRQIAATLKFPWSAALCCGVTAFGGLSGFAQTANVLKDSGLNTGRYFLWKLLQGFLATVIVLSGSFFYSSSPS